MTKTKRGLAVWALTLMSTSTLMSPPAAAQSTGAVTTTAADGVRVHAETYFGDLGPETPLVLLFHQGGSNGRGEYAGLAPWLNDLGLRVIAWDQRSGGELYGSENRTVRDLDPAVESGFCAAYADLEAALSYVVAEDLADRVVLWGSSYSGSLVFRLAAEHPERVLGLVGFSPASGGPVVDCRARMWVDDVAAPMMVLRPDSEMEREPSQEQARILRAAGAEVVVVDGGVHGSSMLVDARTERDMSGARAQVAAWLERVTHR